MVKATIFISLFFQFTIAYAKDKQKAVELPESNDVFCARMLKKSTCDNIPQSEYKERFYTICCSDRVDVDPCKESNSCHQTKDKKKVVCFDEFNNRTVYDLVVERPPGIWSKISNFFGRKPGPEELSEPPDQMESK